MKITIPANKPITDFGADAETPVAIEPVETKTIDLYDKFYGFIEKLREQGYHPNKIVMHHKIYILIKQSSKYHSAKMHNSSGDEMFLGMKIESKDLGIESITDFIIYTDRKVVHSEMLEKTFLEDIDDKKLVDNLDVEELVHETNNRIEDRDQQKDL